jgi:peptide/nickel transport system substrate-binding protein
VVVERRPVDDSLALGIVLEPPGLDPTIGAAASIGEIVQKCLLVGLTKIEKDSGN